MSIWKDLTELFFETDQIEQMTKSYKDTYMILIVDDNEYLVRYQGYQDKYHMFKDEHGQAIYLTQDTKYPIKTVFPNKGLYNHQNNLMFFYRLPNRQWKKAIHKENCRLEYIGHSFWPGSNGSGSGMLDSNTIKSILYPKDISFSLGIEHLIQEKKIGFAINREFGLLQSITKDPEKLIFFYQDTAIGYYDVKNQTLVIKEKEFHQEIKDNSKLFEDTRIIYA